MTLASSRYLEKISGQFEYTNTLKSYMLNDKWVQDYTSMWDLLSTANEAIGQTIYEHIGNFVQNVRDIDTCDLHRLYSIAKEMNVSQIFSYDLNYPTELNDLMNILSVSKSNLLLTGSMLSNNSLSSIYADYGASTSGVPYVDDAVYISGFVEASIHELLSEYSSLTGTLSGRGIEYQDFMDAIYTNPNVIWSASTSADIIDECTHTLRNIAIRASYHRDTLKRVAQKYAMIGTDKALQKLIQEYLLKSFTKKSDWRLYVSPSGAQYADSVNDTYEIDNAVPAIQDINGYFNLDVIEYYDGTEYLNVSAASPLICGIIGYTNTYVTTSTLDISGNLISGLVSGLTPVYGTGLCGYMVTGGNERYWQGSVLTDSMSISESTSSDLDAYFEAIGLSGNTYAENIALMNDMYDTGAVSGFDHNARIPSLSADNVSLSAIQTKYIGTSRGSAPAANIKNQDYPSLALQPFIWNLVEKSYGEFPTRYSTVLFTETTDTFNLSSQVDAAGNLIDSWRKYNQELDGYQTAYENSMNLNSNNIADKRVDRDGPFDLESLSAYLSNLDMTNYYTHISSSYAVSGIPVKVSAQMDAFRDDISALSGKMITQYSYDIYDNHFMLYKDENDITVEGRLWCRYKDHPLAFPMCYGSTLDWQKQQVYCRGQLSLYELGYIVDNAVYDFGFVDNVMWVLGKDSSDALKIIVFSLGYSTFQSPINGVMYSVVVNDANIPRMISVSSMNNYIGTYTNGDYIIFVMLDSWIDSTTAKFTFKHYNKSSYKFETSPLESRTVSNLPATQFVCVEYPNVWRLAASDDTVTIAYEAVNTHGGDNVNTVVTIAMNKNSLSVTEDIEIKEWTDFYDVI